MPRVCGGMRKMGSLYVLHARRHPKVESLDEACTCRRRTRTRVRACIPAGMHARARARACRLRDQMTRM